MKLNRYYFYIILVVLSLNNCKKTEEPESSFLLFPAGRSFLGTSGIEAMN